MLVDTHNLVSLTEANQNFSRVARMVDERGSVVILRNNVPRYVVIAFDQIDDTAASDDQVLAAGAMFIDKHRGAFDELAK
ncbi:type II toxin-antitoxin system Phd/YefM family antitoxin [Cellulomonas hominis]